MFETTEWSFAVAKWRMTVSRSLHRWLQYFRNAAALMEQPSLLEQVKQWWVWRRGKTGQGGGKNRDEEAARAGGSQWIVLPFLASLLPYCP